MRSIVSILNASVFDWMFSFHTLQVELAVNDMETILNTLIYDGKITQSVRVGQGGSQGQNQVKVYRVAKPLIETTGLMRMPCGFCPVSVGLWNRIGTGHTWGRGKSVCTPLSIMKFSTIHFLVSFCVSLV